MPQHQDSIIKEATVATHIEDLDDAGLLEESTVQRNRRHRKEAEASYATVSELAMTRSDLGHLKETVKELRTTIQGEIVGVNRVPGIVDVVASLSSKMASIARVLYAIGAVLTANLAVEVLKTFGVIHQVFGK